MSLEQVKKDLEDQLKSALEAENEVEETEEEVEEEITEETTEEVVEEAKEEEKVEAKKEELDDSGYARLRRDKAAAEKRAKELEDRLAALENQSKPQEQEVLQETPVSLPPEVQEMVQSHIMTKAEREFQSLESEFRGTVDDYDGIANAYHRSLAWSVKLQNPQLTDEQCFEQAKTAVLHKAAHYLRQGYNPIEELYHEAKQLGIQAPVEVEEKEVAPKADLNRLAANRNRNSGMAAAKGAGGTGVLTAKAASEMPSSEWMKLSKEEKARVMASLR